MNPTLDSPLMTPARMDALLAIYRDGLLDDVLPFWFPRSVDDEYGGFLFARGQDGTLLDTDKSVWQQGRCSMDAGHPLQRGGAADGMAGLGQATASTSCATTASTQTDACSSS